MAQSSNSYQCKALRLALPHMDDPVRLAIMEFLDGTGYEDLCDCGQCQNAWFHRGWICPPRWQLHLAIQGLAPFPPDWGR